MQDQVQLTKLNEYLLQVGTVDEPIGFCVNALEKLRRLVPFDQGRVYYMDDDGKVFDEYLIGVSKKDAKAYHEYYGTLETDRYNATKKAKVTANALAVEKKRFPGKMGTTYSLTQISVVDWSKEPHNTRFYREYVAKLGLTYSTGFLLYGSDGFPRALFCVDRTRRTGYSPEECKMLSLVATHLDNMYRKIYVPAPASGGDTIALMSGGAPLTERERQIATMLMRGFATKTIAQVLGISPRTVYKHVSNIHTKLGVTNQVELIAKLTVYAAQGTGGEKPTQR